MGILDVGMAASIPIFDLCLAHIPRLAIRRRAGPIPWAVVDILDAAHAALFSNFMLNADADGIGLDMGHGWWMAPQRMQTNSDRASRWWCKSLIGSSPLVDVKKWVVVGLEVFCRTWLLWSRSAFVRARGAGLLANRETSFLARNFYRCSDNTTQ